MIEYVVTVIIAIAGSSAIFTFVQYLLERRDKKNDKIDQVITKMSEINSTIDKKFDAVNTNIEELRTDMNINDEKLRASLEATKATTARVRILRASDEILHKMKHSKEWFDQLNDDITFYQTYCKDHPEFINNKAKHAIDNINKIYAKALDEGNFL